MTAANLKTFGALSMFLLAMVCTAAGRTIYVDDDGPADFNNIQAAVDDANYGDTILVAAGTYYENVRMKDGLVLQGAGADVTTIDGGENGHVVSFNLASGTISGFTITNSGDDPGYLAGIFTSQCTVTITGNIITNNASGISISSNSTAVIVGNRIMHSTWVFGTSIRIISSTATITNNLITDSIWAGIWSSGYSSSLFIANNTIARNGYYGMLLGYLRDHTHTVCNNIVAENKWGIMAVGVESSPVGLLDITYNDVWNNWQADYWVEWNEGSEAFLPQPGTGEISQEPLFTDANAGNYRVLPASPCIDAGDNNSVAPDTADLDGDGDTNEPTPIDLNRLPRFVDDLCTVDTGNGSPPVVDMGAYEFSWVSIGDFDSECDTDLGDFAILALAWLTEEGQAGYNAACDISIPADQRIDGRDLRVYVEYWLANVR